MSIIGLILGSGGAALPQFERLPDGLDTPYGQAVDGFFRGILAGAELLVLHRHGQPRRYAPHAINYRANLWRLQALGVERLVAIYTVGAIAAGLQPGDLAAPDQLIDYSWGRAQTFDDGGATHVDFTKPFDAELTAALAAAAQRAAVQVAAGGVYGCTQGPRLETAAEIDRMERDSCTLVGMTAMPEAALARELGLPLAPLCIVVNPAAGRGAAADHIDLGAVQEASNKGLAEVLAVLREFLGKERPRR